MPETSPKHRRRGRPTGIESLDIDQTITRMYLGEGASPGFIIQKTGFGKDTVYTKCKALLETIMDQNTKDFGEKIEQERIQFVLSMDSLIHQTHQVLEQVEKRLEKYFKKKQDPPEYLLQKFSDLTKNLVNMKKEKAEKSMQLPLEKELQKKIEEEVAKSVN